MRKEHNKNIAKRSMTMQKLCTLVYECTLQALSVVLSVKHWFENGFQQIASSCIPHSFTTNESNHIIFLLFTSFHFIVLFLPSHRSICLQLQSATTVHMYKYIMVLPYKTHFVCSVFPSFCSFSFWSRLLFSLFSVLVLVQWNSIISNASKILVPSNIISKLKAKINGS